MRARTVLEGIEVVNGDLITEDIAPTMFQSHGFDNTASWLRYTTNGFFSLIKPYPQTSGPGTLANVTFRVIAKGTSNITLEDQGMHGEHALRTRLIGYTDGGWGDFYNIIDSATMPDHIQHGYFENVLCMHADWSRTYGGTAGEEGECLVETVDGGYALAGRTNYFGAGTNDSWLVKVDSSGNHEWNRTYGGGNGDVARSVVQTSDGGYALTGTTYSFGAGDVISG